MPTRIITPLRAALFGALVAAFIIPASAGATRPAELRVVDPEGETLTQNTQYTGRSKIKTDKRADCFGEGTGGSGKRVTVRGATALGLIDDAKKWDRANRFDGVRPLSVSDSFGLGLAVCGIGGVVAPQTGFWYLKVNHVASQVGGDQASLRTGDEVLWYLIEDFSQPIPVELELTAPARAKIGGGDVRVRVWQYADNGSRRPAVGASVTGASQPTDERGRTELDQLSPGSSQKGRVVAPIQASREGAIPSAFEPICFTRRLKRCQTQPPTEIYGTEKKDIIRGTRGDDEIRAGKGKDVVRGRRGDDFIDVRGGGRDLVNCGGGNDKVRAGKRDKLKGCG